MRASLFADQCDIEGSLRVMEDSFYHSKHSPARYYVVADSSKRNVGVKVDSREKIFVGGSIHLNMQALACWWKSGCCRDVYIGFHRAHSLQVAA